MTQNMERKCACFQEKCCKVYIARAGVNESVQVTKSFPNENKRICRDGTLKNQPNKMGTTPQHIYTIPTSCAILPTMLCVC